LKTRGNSSIHRGHIHRVWIRPIREIQVIFSTWIIGIRVRIIGLSRVEILNIINFIGALGKRAPNLIVQRYMLN